MDIVLIGSGNVASHLGKAFLDAGHQIKQVWSRNIDHAQCLADSLQAVGTNQLTALLSEADVYVLAVVDDAIEEVLAQIPSVSGCIVHTSGSTDMAIMPINVKNYGVFYPLQTFSKGKEINFMVTPILLEASDGETLAILRELALSISQNVQECSSKQRKILHIAAVFSCNFSNHLYVIAQRLLEDEGLDFHLIRPLIQETAEKVHYQLPDRVQTGPAVRNDRMTLAHHRKQLIDHPDWLEIYNVLSNAIWKEKQKQ